MSLPKRVSTAICALLAVALLAGCNKSADPEAPSNAAAPTLPAPEFPNYPAQANDFRFQWSAAPGIDLTTGPSVAVRAYIESVRLAAFTFGDRSAVYPGFLQSTLENSGEPGKEGSVTQLEYIRPKTRAEYEADGLSYVERQVYGYQPTYIARIEPRGEKYMATVCVGAYSVYRTDDADRSRYFSTAADEDTGSLLNRDSEIQYWRVELTDTDPRKSAMPTLSSPQVGPMPAPVDDVFGPWLITGAGITSWGTIGEGLEYFATPELRAQCDAAMPDDAATRLAMATGFHDAPPPHGNPIPGWPAEAR